MKDDDGVVREEAVMNRWKHKWTKIITKIIVIQKYKPSK